MTKDRKDWEGRTPRWRASLTVDRVRRTVEAYEYFITMKDLQQDPRYTEDLDYYRQTLANFDTLLPEVAATSAPLFDNDWFEDAIPE